MARFRLGKKASARKLGKAVFAAAIAHAKGGRDPKLERKIRKLIEQKDGDQVKIHYDGYAKGSGDRVIHIIVPDLSDKTNKGVTDLTEIANEAVGTLGLGGYTW
jgi:transcriptional/translational regulatory protein YebC/TACO1